MATKSRESGIGVTIVLFYAQHDVPKTIKLSEVTTKLSRSIPGYITGLSGHQSLEGFMLARKYADERKMEMVLVDVLLGFDKPLYPNLMSPEELPKHDVISMIRCSKNLIGEIGAFWRDCVEEHPERGSNVDSYDYTSPADFMARRCEFIPEFLASPRYKHINLLTHPVLTAFSDKPLLVTSFPIGYPQIRHARTRLHPDIEVVV